MSDRRERERIAADFRERFPELHQLKETLDRAFFRDLPTSSGTNAVILDALESLWRDHFERFYPFVWVSFSRCFRDDEDQAVGVGALLDQISRFIWSLTLITACPDGGAGATLAGLSPGIRLLVVDGLYTLILEKSMQGEGSAAADRFLHRLVEEELCFPAAEIEVPDLSVPGYYQQRMRAIVRRCGAMLLGEDEKVGKWLDAFLDLAGNMDGAETAGAERGDGELPPALITSSGKPGMIEWYRKLTEYCRWLSSNDLVRV